MARRSFFMQGAGESGNDDDDLDDFGGGDFAPTPRQAVASGQALGPPSPSSSAETSEWITQPQANPFAPSGPLPSGPQPTSHPYSPPEQEMGPPPQPEYNPLAGLLPPNVPAYAQEGAQPARQPGDASYLSEMFAASNPEQQASGSSSLDNLLYSPPGSTLGGPNPWDRTTPPPEPEPEEEDGGSWWDWAPGDFDLDSIPQRALGVISNTGNVDETIQNAVDPRAMPVPESEELDYAGGLEAETREWAQEQVDTAQWIASDPIGAGSYLGNPHNWDDMAEAAIQNYRENPEDAVFDFGFGAATSAGTGAATAGVGGLIYRGLSRAGVPDVPPSAVSAAQAAIPDLPDHVPTPSSAIRTASGVPASEAAPSPSPGVARLMDEATSPAPAAPDVLGPQYQLPDVAPAVARAAGAPDLSGPRYQLPDAPAARAIPEAGAPDMSGPRYQMPDAPAVGRAVDADVPSPSPVGGPSRSLLDMDAAARAAAPDVEDVADAADNVPLSALERLDARWNRNIERRQQRRSARQPTNIARRIVGREQVFKPYTWSQRQMTRAGDWVGGGPGAEGSPNLLRQYVRSRLNRTDTMPEFPEGTNRALTGYERTQWRNQQLMRQPNRVRRASHAVGSAVDAVEDAQRFLDFEWDPNEAPVGGSIYGEDEITPPIPGRGFRRASNFPGASPTRTPASQAYGQETYVPGRGHGRGM